MRRILINRRTYRCLKSIFTIRIFACSLSLFAMIFYVILPFYSSYLWVVIRGLSSSSHAPSSSVFLTWEIPDFAYYNNQLLLHFGTIAYMPMGTQFLSPDFLFPRMRGMNATYISTYELYDRTRLKEIHLFDRQSIQGQHFTIHRTPWLHVALKWLSESNDTIINITNVQNGIRTEDLWRTIFTRIILRVFFFNQNKDIVRIAHSFEYTNDVQKCVSLILNKYPNLTQALGIHLRTWAADLSIGSVSSRECVSIHQNNPLNIFFKCQILTEDDLKIIRGSIERSQRSFDQPIYLVTDNHQSSLVIQLKGIYGNRLMNIEEKCQEDKRYIALIENELLTRTDSFLGSFFSTFSLVIAIRRGIHRTYFIQTTQQYYLYYYLTWIILGCLLFILVIFFLLVNLCKCMRKHLCSKHECYSDFYCC